jgi:asparagine synthase (glutamine-hydrolysing)
VPFLDHELVELAMAMPRHLKIDGGEGKVGLKRTVADLLPDELVWRPKQGFGAPVAQWFRGDLGAELRARLRSSAITELGWLDPKRVEAIADLHAGGRADRSFQLWNLVNLAFWFDHWIAGRPA